MSWVHCPASMKNTFQLCVPSLLSIKWERTAQSTLIFHANERRPGMNKPRKAHNGKVFPIWPGNASSYTLFWQQIYLPMVYFLCNIKISELYCTLYCYLRWEGEEVLGKHGRWCEEARPKEAGQLGDKIDVHQVHQDTQDRRSMFNSSSLNSGKIIF